MPLVSIIVPTFNRLQYLQPALASVFAQTATDWELVIADDGSNDETRAYLRGLSDARVRTLWLAHSGNPSRVRNAGLGVATGRYVAFLDSDDIWAPSKLEKQTRALRDRPDRRWSYTGCDRIDEEGRPLVNERLALRVAPEGWILEALLGFDAVVPMPAVIAERDLVATAGGFDEGQRFCEYHDLSLRLAMRSAVSVVREPLCSIRAHGDHYSRDRIGEYQAWVRLYGKMAATLPDPRLRSLCLKHRADVVLTLAGLQGDAHDHRALWTTLGRASVYSWRYPDWWLGAAKAVARSLTPGAMLLAYRRAREQVARPS